MNAQLQTVLDGVGAAFGDRAVCRPIQGPETPVHALTQGGPRLGVGLMPFGSLIQGSPEGGGARFASLIRGCKAGDNPVTRKLVESSLPHGICLLACRKEPSDLPCRTHRVQHKMQFRLERGQVKTARNVRACANTGHAGIWRWLVMWLKFSLVYGVLRSYYNGSYLSR